VCSSPAAKSQKIEESLLILVMPKYEIALSTACETNQFDFGLEKGRDESFKRKLMLTFIAYNKKSQKICQKHFLCIKITFTFVCLKSQPATAFFHTLFPQRKTHPKLTCPVEEKQRSRNARALSSNDFVISPFSMFREGKNVSSQLF